MFNYPRRKSSRHDTSYYTTSESSSTMEEESTVTSEEENSTTTTEDDTVSIEDETILSYETYQEDTVSSEDYRTKQHKKWRCPTYKLPRIDKTHSHGRYQYETILGQGGFGTVIKAEAVKTRQSVAIKMVKARKTALKEINTLMSLPHPNVVGFLDHYQYANGVAIVMEFCPGGSLKDQINTCSNKREPIEASLRYEWYMQLASGLQFIHNQRIIHRDLKPDNILITANDSLKIADVGLAKAAWDRVQSDSSGDSFCMYQTSIVGTRPYMAPEVRKGHYTEFCDIFSLGLIFWIMAAMPSKRTTPCSVVKGSQYWLGQLLIRHSIIASDVLVPPTCSESEQEVNLIDSMLHARYKKRPVIDKILAKIANLKAEALIGSE